MVDPMGEFNLCLWSSGGDVLVLVESLVLKPLVQSVPVLEKSLFRVNWVQSDANNGTASVEKRVAVVGNDAIFGFPLVDLTDLELVDEVCFVPRRGGLTTLEEALALLKRVVLEAFPGRIWVFVSQKLECLEDVIRLGLVGIVRTFRQEHPKQRVVLVELEQSVLKVEKHLFDQSELELRVGKLGEISKPHLDLVPIVNCSEPMPLVPRGFICVRVFESRTFPTFCLIGGIVCSLGPSLCDWPKLGEVVCGVSFGVPGKRYQVIRERCARPTFLMGVPLDRLEISLSGHELLEDFLENVESVPRWQCCAAPLDSDGPYLISGGTGGLGIQTALMLIERGARDIVLLSRSGKPPALSERDWGMLSNVSVRVSVSIELCNVADRAKVAALFAKLANQGRDVCGIVHSTHLLKDEKILGWKMEDMKDVYDAKVNAAWNLHEESLRLSRLRHFIVYSSVASLMGNFGTVNHSANSASLDALSCLRNQIGLPTVSLQLGAVEEVGIAARFGYDAIAHRGGIRPLSLSLFREFVEYAMTDQSDPVLALLPFDFSVALKNRAFKPMMSEIETRLAQMQTQTVDIWGPRCRGRKLVVIIGAGLQGLAAARFLQRRGYECVIFEKNAFVGGAWRSQGNAHSCAQTESATYHLDFEHEEASEWISNYTGRDELLEYCEAFVERSGLKGCLRLEHEVTKVAAPTPTPRGEERGQAAVWFRKRGEGAEQMLRVAHVMIFPGRLGKRRELALRGEGEFGRPIRYGTGDEVSAEEIRGKKHVVVIGHGAFALETARLACESGVDRVSLVCRTRSPVLPRLASWAINATAHGLSFEGVEALMETAYGRLGSGAGGRGKLGSQSGLVPVSDVFFLAQMLGKLEVIEDTVQELKAGGRVVTSKGRELECDYLVKCVGFEADRSGDHLVAGFKSLHGLWVNGCSDVFLYREGRDLKGVSLFDSTTAMVLLWRALEAAVFLFDHPERQPGELRLPVVETTGEYGALHVGLTLATLARSFDELKQAFDRVLARKQSATLKTHPLEKIVEECKRDWKRLGGLMGASEADIPEYLFDKNSIIEPVVSSDLMIHSNLSSAVPMERVLHVGLDPSYLIARRRFRSGLLVVEDGCPISRVTIGKALAEYVDQLTCLNVSSSENSFSPICNRGEHDLIACFRINGDVELVVSGKIVTMKLKSEEISLSQALGFSLQSFVLRDSVLEFGLPTASPKIFSSASSSLPSPSAAIEKSRADVENIVISTIRAVTGMSAEQIVHMSSSFLDLGFDSQLSVELVSLLSSKFDFDLPATLLFDYPSPVQLVSRIAFLTTSGSGLKIADPSFITSVQASNCYLQSWSCRFGRDWNCSSLWNSMISGSDCVFSDPKRCNLSDTVWGGYFCSFVGMDLFDPLFFSISPAEAQSLDPQQRLLLECSLDCVVSSQIAMNNERMGVFVGIASSDFAILLEPATRSGFSGTGTACSIAAGRISYLFGFSGPALSIDTACSSSLVALDQACAYQFDSLSLGVNALCHPGLFETFGKAGMLSPDGRCKTFDASANGYVRGEGCGGVLLGRGEENSGGGGGVAVAGHCVNQDGRSNGLTAPNGPSQVRLIREALKTTREQQQPVFIEAHGTGTALGDPIEVQAIGEVMRGRTGGMLIGSSKTNFGHTETASGMLGVLKAMLCLERGAVPRHLHLKLLNGYIGVGAMEEMRAVVASETVKMGGMEAWSVGVSSFGFSGTNAHVVLEKRKKEAFGKGWSN
jgi:3-oxoacyl-(acyl-carrier-protein) synthase/acyl carrier protein